MTQYPILKFPHFNQPFILTTDVWLFNCSSISQDIFKEYKLNAFVSRTLNKGELNYSSVEKRIVNYRMSL